MADPIRKRAAYLWFCVAIASGCSEELGPETWDSTHVRGMVTVSGRPVSGGWIEFLPVDGTVGNLRSAPIGLDGTFSADRVPVGPLAIAFESLPSPPIPTPFGPVSPHEFRFFATPVRRTVSAGSSTRLDVDLALEAFLMQKTRQERLRRQRAVSE